MTNLTTSSVDNQSSSSPPPVSSGSSSSTRVRHATLSSRIASSSVSPRELDSILLDTDTETIAHANPATAPVRSPPTNPATTSSSSTTQPIDDSEQAQASAPPQRTLQQVLFDPDLDFAMLAGHLKLACAADFTGKETEQLARQAHAEARLRMTLMHGKTPRAKDFTNERVRRLPIQIDHVGLNSKIGGLFSVALTGHY